LSLSGSNATSSALGAPERVALTPTILARPPQFPREACAWSFAERLREPLRRDYVAGVEQLRQLGRAAAEERGSGEGVGAFDAEMRLSSNAANS
jgi:hypothetical protein